MSNSFNKFPLLTFLPIFFLPCPLFPFYYFSGTISEVNWDHSTSFLSDSPRQISILISPPLSPIPPTTTSNTSHFPPSRASHDLQSFAPLQLDRIWLKGYNIPAPLELLTQTPSIPSTVKHEGDKKQTGKNWEKSFGCREN